jgi:hypothetical protein
MEVGETRVRHFLITRPMLDYLVLMHAVLTERSRVIRLAAEAGDDAVRAS